MPGISQLTVRLVTEASEWALTRTTESSADAFTSVLRQLQGPRERVGRVKAAKRRSAAEGSLEAPHVLPYNRMPERVHDLQHLNSFVHSRSAVSLVGRSNAKLRRSPFTLY